MGAQRKRIPRKGPTKRALRRRRLPRGRAACPPPSRWIQRIYVATIITRREARRKKESRHCLLMTGPGSLIMTLESMQVPRIGDHGGAVRVRIGGGLPCRMK
ncbi:hypothetical protein X975_10736, partial [Stegodyphus mimosarum]